MKEPRNVAIIHYNTPELTEAAILSLRKHGGEGYKVTVFDNSDSRPFRKKMKGVKRIDNTKGKVIDWEEFLAQFPERTPRIGCASGCVFGSAKHMRTVQELWGILPEGFLLMESDILIREDIDFMFMKDKAVVGHVVDKQKDNPFSIGRVMPLLCYMNVPLLVSAGARYFDPDRSYGLHAGYRNKRNWYDTGSVLLEDVKRLKPMLVGRNIDIRPLMVHYKSASWKRNVIDDQLAWLDQHKELWK
jgi:hypothetical protein